MVYFAAAALAPLMTFADVRLANGVRLHYAQQGPQSGPAIVLLHGYSDSSFSYSRVMPLLPRELRVIALDLRGHGESDRPLTGYRMGEMAEDVIQAMDALKVPTAIVVGHSMGSFIAQSIVERAPGRVSRLVLLGSAPHCDNDVVRAVGASVQELSDPVSRDFVREFQYSTVVKPVPDAFMNTAIDNSSRMPAAIWKAIMAGLLDYRPVQPRSNVPTLVIGGDKDAVFSSAEQIALAIQYPNSQLNLVNGVGHSLHWEQPQAFVDALLRFIETPGLAFADVTLANGVRLHYAQQGPQSGPAIVMLHGYSDSSFSFSRVMPLLPHKLRVVALELRGHGDSDRPANGYRITEMADDVIQAMNALRIPTAVIVGHSMGSFVAQAVVERAPARVTNMVLVGSGPSPNNGPMRGMRTDVEALTDPVSVDFVRAFQYGTIAQPVPDAFMTAAIDNSRRMPARVWQQTLDGMLSYQPVTPRGAVRTLVLGGRKDSVFSVDEHVALSRQFPNASVELFDDAGHTLHWEQPQAFVDALLRFITN